MVTCHIMNLLEVFRDIPIIVPVVLACELKENRKKNFNTCTSLKFNTV